MSDTDDEARPLPGAKPCPFCGGSKVSTYPGSTFRWRFASCDECGGSTGEVRINTMTVARPAAIEGAQQELLDEWNKRAVQS